MNRLTQHAALFSGLLGIFAAGLVAMTIFVSGLFSAYALLPWLLVWVVVSLAVALRSRLARMAAEEKRDQAVLAQNHPETSLFQNLEREADPFSREKTRQRFERFMVPLIAPGLGILLLYASFVLYRTLAWSEPAASSFALAGSIFGGMAFVFFLTSRFLLGLSRQPESRLLRGPGVWAGLLCYGGLLGLAAAMAGHFGFSQGDLWTARLLLAASALSGIELLLNALVALYRHQRGQPITTYETRLGALLVDPGIFTKSITEAMDYQFGFSFSRTWFFRLMQRAILPLMLLQVALLYGMTSLVFLAPHETGILEQWGRPVSPETLPSGFHLKKPWPFETVRRIPTGRIHVIEVGFETDDHEFRPDVITWTIPHYTREDAFLVAARSDLAAGGGHRDASGVPVSMVTVNVQVEYRITNAYFFAYHYTDPASVIRQMAYQTLTRQLASRDLNDLLGEQRGRIRESIREELQAHLDAGRLGVEVMFLGLPGVHPPVQVAEAFQSVVGALEEKEATILEARAYTNQVVPLARAYAAATQFEAEAYRQRRQLMAGAEANHFARRQIAYRSSPRVYRSFQYLDLLKVAAAPSRLYVLELPEQGTQTLWLNLEEKPFSGSLEMAPLMMEEEH